MFLVEGELVVSHVDTRCQLFIQLSHITHTLKMRQANTVSCIHTRKSSTAFTINISRQSKKAIQTPHLENAIKFKSNTRTSLFKAPRHTAIQRSHPRLTLTLRLISTHAPRRVTTVINTTHAVCLYPHQQLQQLLHTTNATATY